MVKILVQVGAALNKKHKIKEVSRRDQSSYFHLRIPDGELCKVFKTIFLNTFVLVSEQCQNGLRKMIKI